jgi:hypothetical protein
MTPSYESDPAEPKIVPKERWWSEPARPAQSEGAATAGRQGEAE